MVAQQTAQTYAQPEIQTGLAIIGEGQPVIPTDAATWGQVSTYGSDYCSFSSHAQCGDPLGCVPTSSFWSTPGPGASVNPSACFAVSTCPITPGSQSCVPATPWGSRPYAHSTGTAVVVRVVFHYHPLTPLGAQFFPNGIVILQRDLIGMPLY